MKKEEKCNHDWEAWEGVEGADLFQWYRHCKKCYEWEAGYYFD